MENSAENWYFDIGSDRVNAIEVFAWHNFISFLLDIQMSKLAIISET